MHQQSIPHAQIGRREFLKDAAICVVAATAGAVPAPGAVIRPPDDHARPRVGSAPQSAGVLWRKDTGHIWFPDQAPYFETPRNVWCNFRKSFHLSAQERTGSLRIMADARYRLFVNGAYVGRGPARSDPRWQYYDEIELNPYLRPGENLIAVQVLYYGYGTGQHIPRVPGLAAELTIRGDGQDRLLRTDGSWLTRLSEAFDSSAPRVNGCQGIIEIFDARRESLAWTRLEFDDAAWLSAKVRVFGSWQVPFYRMVARDIPLLEEREVTAQLVTRPEVLIAATGEFMPARLRAELDQIRAQREFVPLTAELSSYAATAADRVQAVTVDFGRVEPGHLQLDVTGPAGSRIDVVYAEVLWEGRAIFNPAAQRPIDSFILAEGRNELEVSFAWKGFRYLHLLIRNPGGPLRIDRVGIRTRAYPLKVIGSVSTPDPVQGTISAMCERTLRICMQDAFVDSPSREQQQWMGDARWQAVYNYYLGGDPRLHRKLLRQIGQSQDASGLTKSRYPDGHENWAPIPAYCLAWVTSFEDYHQFTGDAELVREWWPNLMLALRWFNSFENMHGLLEAVPHWSYIDTGAFPEGRTLDSHRGGINTTLNLFYVEALAAAARLAPLAGDVDGERDCALKAERVRAAIRARLWDDSRRAYPDCWVEGKASEVISEPTNALALLHLPDPGRRADLLHLFRAGAEKAGVLRSSPFLLPVVLRALIANGRVTRAWELVRERYQPMIDAGSATTWEHWGLFHKDTSGQLNVTSASHAWGAGPLVLFFEGFAGVRALVPGFKRFALKPQLAGFPSVSFSMPCPAGLISGHCVRSDGGGSLEFVVPPGTLASVEGRDYGPGTHRVDVQLE